MPRGGVTKEGAVQGKSGDCEEHKLTGSRTACGQQRDSEGWQFVMDDGEEWRTEMGCRWTDDGGGQGSAGVCVCVYVCMCVRVARGRAEAETAQHYFSLHWTLLSHATFCPEHSCEEGSWSAGTACCCPIPSGTAGGQRREQGGTTEPHQRAQRDGLVIVSRAHRRLHPP